MKKCALILSAILLLTFLTDADTGQALMLKMSTAELTGHADAIIRGKVTEMKSEWDPQRRFIWTLVTILVSKSIKGGLADNQTVTVKIPGGVVGDVGQVTEHAPSFKIGEDVVLFLNGENYRGKKVFRVTGKFQGKHTVKDGMLLEKKMPVADFLDQIDKEVKK